MKRESIEKYQEIFRKDPNSQVFAALAEAYRDNGLLEQAEKIARHGIQRHPSYVSGYVALGRIFVDQQRWKDAEMVLQKATSLNPENLLSHQLLGQVYLQTKRPKEALRAYKLVLFLNPQSEMARRAVEKLETLTADEFENDIFEMKKLKGSTKVPSEVTVNAKGLGPSKERSLSLVDALLVRNDLRQAKEVLKELAGKYPEDPEILERWEMIEEEEYEAATPIEPDLQREAFIRDRKFQRLQAVLRRIKTQQLTPKN